MLWWDPTPTAIATERAPRSVNWIERVDDLAWLRRFSAYRRKRQN